MPQGALSYVNLLPGLGGHFTPASATVVVCEACGLIRFFADPPARAKLEGSAGWTPVPRS